MALPSFIDVVVVQTSIDVDTTFRKGAETIKSDSTLMYVSSDPIDPASGDAVLDQAQIGVKTQGQSFQPTTTWWGGNADIQVLDAGANFVFQATDDQGLQTEILNQAPILPLFSSNIIWV